MMGSFVSDEYKAMCERRNAHTIVCDVKNNDMFYLLDPEGHLLLKTKAWMQLVRFAQDLGFTGTTGMKTVKINDPKNTLWWWEECDYIPPGQLNLFDDETY